MNITLTISDPTVELLDALKGFIKPIKASNGTAVKAMAPVAELPAAANSLASKSIEEVTLEVLRAAVQEKAKANKRDQVKALLKTYDAENVTALDKKHYVDFLSKVKEL